MQPLKIVICEDHNLTIDGLRVILSVNPKFMVAGHANNSEQLFGLLDEVSPDILIMDINLGKENGLSLLEKVREKSARIRVLILTMYDDPSLVNQAKELKANGYLTKSAGSQELVHALDAIMDDGFYESPSALTKRLNGIKKRDEFIEKMKLTKREVEIISLVGKGKNAETISEQLFLSLHTVRTHKKNIMKKLGLRTTAEMVHYAMENNLA
jgi:DNA-binding NarL/FixJ family response regulator